jgi:hypothetical protein
VVPQSSSSASLARYWFLSASPAVSGLPMVGGGGRMGRAPRQFSVSGEQVRDSEGGGGGGGSTALHLTWLGRAGPV